MLEALWLLLPIAAASGWYAARRSFVRRKNQQCAEFSSDYFKGLSYLLNEQPDKAIEVFIRMVEVDSDTVETHLALGSLFRRRGEVDRAIRIHQNLIARPTLNRDQRTQALLELGEDYMKAGLFDRAESLFQELIELNVHTRQALGHLIDIYQQEKDWENAISIARKYENLTGRSQGEIIAQFYCELADKSITERNDVTAEKMLKLSSAHDQNCVRASILQGDIARRKGEYKKAIKAYRRVIDQDIEYLPEVLDRLQICYHELGNESPMQQFLNDILVKYNGISPMLAQAEYILEEHGEKEAMRFMAEQLRNKPSVRGLNWILEQSLSKDDNKSNESLTILYELTRKLLEDKPVYECRKCGFTGKSLHWQCPGCKSWNSVKPIKGVEGE